jgi:hypothetical protein
MISDIGTHIHERKKVLSLYAVKNYRKKMISFNFVLVDKLLYKYIDQFFFSTQRKSISNPDINKKNKEN